MFKKKKHFFTRNQFQNQLISILLVTLPELLTTKISPQNILPFIFKSDQIVEIWPQMCNLRWGSQEIKTIQHLPLLTGCYSRFIIKITVTEIIKGKKNSHENLTWRKIVWFSYKLQKCRYYKTLFTKLENWSFFAKNLTEQNFHSPYYVFNINIQRRFPLLTMRKYFPICPKGTKYALINWLYSHQAKNLSNSHKSFLQMTLAANSQKCVRVYKIINVCLTCTIQ